jgi:hypothetical protein
LGPDGTPWDPERRAKRQAERGTTGDTAVNNAGNASVEGQTPSAPAASGSESQSE